MSSFTTLETAKKFLRIENNSDDDLITKIINNVSILIETYTYRKLLNQRHSTIFSGKGSNFHTLPNFPVTSINSLKIDKIDYQIEFDKDYIYTDDMIVLHQLKFNRGIMNCEIFYSAGYDVIPEDIEQCCLEMVAIKYKQLEHIDLSSKAVAGETTSFIMSDIPSFVKVVLNKYRKVGPY